MGALTKGDRRAEKAGNLDKYNLESKEGRAALNVVYTRIMNGEEIPDLDNPKHALADMGLLKKGTEGREDISESGKTNIPRFLNRLLSLEVDRRRNDDQTSGETFESCRRKTYPAGRQHR